MAEIQGKSILVRVSARFELARDSSYRESTVYAYNMSTGNTIFNVSDASTLFFSDFLRAQNLVRVIQSKII